LLVFAQRDPKPCPVLEVLPDVPGAPVHVPDPGALGIADLDAPG
jgi:uncharacterized protein YcsI (UPF0317 family)